jgi:type VI secretion system secreted protein VgrG
MDGDPDRPVVVGGMYNGNMAPVFPVPAQQTKTGWRTRSTKSGGTADFSEFSVDDTTGSELMFLHAQKDMTTEVENDQKLTVDNNRTVEVKKDESIKIGHDQTIEIDDKQSTKITAGRTTEITSGGDQLTVKAGDLTISVKTGQVSIEALTAIELKVGSNSIKIDPSGITLNGTMLKLDGTAMVELKGPMTQVKGDGMLMMKGGIVMVN